MVVMAQVRPYRGVEAPDRLAERRRRFLDAGLELLGGADRPRRADRPRDLRRRRPDGAVLLRELHRQGRRSSARCSTRWSPSLATTTQAAVAAAPVAEAEPRAAWPTSSGSSPPTRGSAADVQHPTCPTPSWLRKRAANGRTVRDAVRRAHPVGATGRDRSDRMKATCHFVVGGCRADDQRLAGRRDPPGGRRTRRPAGGPSSTNSTIPGCSASDPDSGRRPSWT